MQGYRDTARRIRIFLKYIYIIKKYDTLTKDNYKNNNHMIISKIFRHIVPSAVQKGNIFCIWQFFSLNKKVITYTESKIRRQRTRHRVKRDYYAGAPPSRAKKRML
jgi:excinuclease UvrABC helicase subunit UvrB